MIKTFTLTEKEDKLVKTCPVNFKEFTDPDGGYYQPNSFDSTQCCFIRKDGHAAGFTRHEVAGLISSLETKGIIWIESRHIDEGPDLYWLTEDFINYIAQLNQATK